MHVSRRVRGTVAAVLLAALGVACQRSSTAPSAELTATLQAIGDGLVELRVQNTGQVAVSLAGCPNAPSFVVERQQGERWAESISVNRICPAIYTPTTLSLTAGAVAVQRVELTQPGVFRARLFVGPDQQRPAQIVTTASVLLP